METGHLPMWDHAAADRLNENGLLAKGGFLYRGEAGGDVLLRHSFSIQSEFSS